LKVVPGQGPDASAIAPDDAIVQEVFESVGTKPVSSDAELSRARGDGWKAFAADGPKKSEPILCAVADVSFKGGKLELHPSWKDTALGPAIEKSKLDLDLVTPEMIRSLSADELRVLMECLARVSLPIERRDPEGALLTGVGKMAGARKIFGKKALDVLAKGLGSTSKESSAIALAQKIWACGDGAALGRLFAASPRSVLPMLDLHAAEILTLEHLPLIMREMRKSILPHSSSKSGEPLRGLEGAELRALGDLVTKYLSLTADGSAVRVKSAVEHLLASVHDAGADEKPADLGIVCGAVISGLHKHFIALQFSRESRTKWIQNTTNLLWASSALFGNIGAAVAVGLVGLSSMHMHRSKPEQQNLAAVCQGELQARWLQYPPEHWSKDDVQLGIAWLGSTILSNQRPFQGEPEKLKGASAERARAMVAEIEANALPSQVAGRLDEAEVGNK
jgi:hypothetical protein